MSENMGRVAEDMVGRLRYMELETTLDFFDFFVEGCLSNPMEPSIG